MCSQTYALGLEMTSTSFLCSSLHTSSIFHLKSTIKWPVLFFDFALTFESVPHQALLNKLDQLILPPVLFRWLHNYLSDRFQWLVLNGTCSSWLPVTSWVPQGSILGLLLLLLYVNDIPNIPFSKDSHLIMYTDDLLLFKPISCQKDLLTFQCDVNLISKWTLQNHLSLNCNKTKYMFISSCNIQFHFPNSCEQQSNWKSSSVRILGGLDLWWPYLDWAYWEYL